MEYINFKHNCETQIIFEQIGYEFAGSSLKTLIQALEVRYLDKGALK